MTKTVIAEIPGRSLSRGSRVLAFERDSSNGMIIARIQAGRLNENRYYMGRMDFTVDDLVKGLQDLLDKLEQ